MLSYFLPAVNVEASLVSLDRFGPVGEPVSEPSVREVLRSNPASQLLTPPDRFATELQCPPCKYRSILENYPTPEFGSDIRVLEVQANNS